MAIALRFISGKYQGGEFPLEENREVIVGRSTDLDMVLVDEMVSRKHARLMLRSGRVELADMDSTNGVFVNGERVKEAKVGVGDRILIGSNILRVVDLGSTTASKPAKLLVAEAPLTNRRAVRRPKGQSAADVRMSGSLDEIPLPDLLQLFGSSRKDGLLWIDGEGAVGRIALKGGKIQHAQIDTLEGAAEPLSVEKAIYRMLSWDHGVFELDPPSDSVYPEATDLSVQEVLMEGFRQKDELSQLQSKLPKGSAKLRLAAPLDPPLRDLAERELDVLQLAINRGTVVGLTSASPLTDLETAEILLRLLDKGYLRADPG